MIHIITENYFLALGIQLQLEKEHLDMHIFPATSDVNVEFKSGDVIFLATNNHNLSRRVMKIASRENARVFYFCNGLDSNYISKMSKTCIISMRIHLQAFRRLLNNNFIVRCRDNANGIINLREFTILNNVLIGKPYKTISDELNLPLKSIYRLKTRALEKLGLDPVRGCSIVIYGLAYKNLFFI
jgi:DNA-binding NarL/FixJ family response regulator